MRWALASACAAACAACGSDDLALVGEYSGPPPYPTRREPLALRSGTYAFVSNALSDSIHVINIDTGEHVREATVGRYPVDVDGPQRVVVDRAGQALYFVLRYPQLSPTGPHAAHSSVQRLGYVEKRSLRDFGLLAELRVDANPSDVELSQDGARVVTSHFDLERADLSSPDRNAKLFVTSTASFGTDSPTRIAVCRAPSGMDLSNPDARYVFVACYADDAMGVVDVDTLQVQLVPMGAALATGAPAWGPKFVRARSDVGVIAVANVVGHSISFFDTVTRTFPSTAVPVGGAAYRPDWSLDGASLLVPTRDPDALNVIDSESRTVSQVRVFDGSECLKPQEVSTIDEERILVVCEGDGVKPGAVLILDRSSLVTQRRIDVGTSPDRAALYRVP